MKVIKEEYKNFPDKLQAVVTSVEAQALEDTAEFDKRKDETEKEVEKQTKLPVDGAPKAEKPEEAIVPDKLKESLEESIESEVDAYLNKILAKYSCEEFINRIQTKLGDEEFFDLMLDAFGDDVNPNVDESFMSGAQETKCDKSCNEELLDENINEEDAARIVQDVIRNSFGIDADVEVYKDKDKSKSVIVQFIISKAENKKMVYDEFKEELNKRFGDNINISCKTFSSPNLAERKVEYKIKVLVIKEKKDKYGAAKAAEKQKHKRDRQAGKDWHTALKEEADIETTAATVLPANDYMVHVPISKELEDLSGITDILKSAAKQTDTIDTKTKKAKKAFAKYMLDNYDINVPIEMISNFSTGKPGIYNWEATLYSPEKEDLQDFLDANNLTGNIKIDNGAEQWQEWGELDAKNSKLHPEKNITTLFDWVWSDLSADTKAEFTTRRLPGIKDDVQTKNMKPPIYPNSLRYKTDDADAATTNGGADVVMRVDYDGNIRITPPNGDIRFAQVVADTYKDYGVKCIPNKDGTACKIVIPEEYADLDMGAAEAKNSTFKHDKGNTDLSAFTDDELYPSMYSRDELGDLRNIDASKSRKKVKEVPAQESTEDNNDNDLNEI